MKNFIVWLYMLLRYRKRYYYVCVTGLQLDGVRMFGGGILITTFGVVPVMAAAKKLKENYKWETCSVINFFRVSKLQYKYYFNEDINVNFTKTYIDATGKEK